jgi:hypothetical protein
MHPNAAKELGELCKAMDEGKIPECAIPRLFYFGHEVASEWEEFPPDNKPILRCVACFKDWPCEKDTDCRICPHCNDLRFHWGHAVVNSVKHIRWRCLDCKHEWEAWDGTECPSCGSKKQSS